MSKQKAIMMLAGFALIPFLGAGALLLFRDVDAVTPESQNRLTVGMDEAAVTRVLGRPRPIAPDRSTLWSPSGRHFPIPEGKKAWFGRDYYIVASFDAYGLATDISGGPLMPWSSETLLARVRRWFGV